MRLIFAGAAPSQNNGRESNHRALCVGEHRIHNAGAGGCGKLRCVLGAHDNEIGALRSALVEQFLIRTIAQLMGHGTIQMSMRYAHLSPDHNQSAVDRLVEFGPEGTPKRTPGKRKK